MQAKILRWLCRDWLHPGKSALDMRGMREEI